MSTFVELLEQRLQQSLMRFPQDNEGTVLPLPDFAVLSDSSKELHQKFEKGKPPEPPLQQRIQALAHLRQQPDMLSNREWRLIGWGLSDECGLAGRPLDDSALYSQIHEYFGEQIRSSRLSRRNWFGLAFSYFAYPSDKPEENPNWSMLKTQVRCGFDMLLSKEKRPRQWSAVMSKNLDLFGGKPGAALGRALFEGNTAPLEELQAQLPIPEASWLWRRIIDAQLEQLSKLSDNDFRGRIEGLLRMAIDYSRYADDILAATLTRYAQSSFRNDSHPALKHTALDMWGSPQIRTSNNRWKAHVDDDVCKMVLRWFAKEDLEHFFKLLQGESGVDQARLDYWLRFVDQIGYTRVVMGGDAFNDRSPDFDEFRRKNKGRFSLLMGGPSNNNAFIMRIGEYYFVEFSAKGNACYFYHSDRLPFNPDKVKLELHSELKQKPSVRLNGSSVYKIPHLQGWQSKADEVLGQLGIHSNGVYPTNNMREAVVNGYSAHKHVSEDASLKTSLESKIREVMRHLETLAEPPKTRDTREKGGAFWVLTDEYSPLASFLKRSGFKYASNRGFWIK